MTAVWPVGRHVGISGGYLKGLAYGQGIGCSALQVFPGNPTGWRHTPLPPAAAAKVRAAVAEHGIAPLVIHAPYIINLAGPAPLLAARSRQALANCFSRAAEIGATQIVLHVGSHKGSGAGLGVARLVEGVLEVLGAADGGGACLLLENSVGAGHTLGGTFAELAEILGQLPEQVGLCLDTAHLWGAGHDISSPDGAGTMVEALERTIGLRRLGLLHLNDSAVALASRRDVHARLGQGQIGLAGLGGVLMALRDAGAHVPIVLETPDDGPAREAGWQELVACLVAGRLEEAQARSCAIMELPITQGSFPDDVPAAGR